MSGEADVGEQPFLDQPGSPSFSSNHIHHESHGQARLHPFCPWISFKQTGRPISFIRSCKRERLFISPTETRLEALRVAHLFCSFWTIQPYGAMKRAPCPDVIHLRYSPSPSQRRCSFLAITATATYARSNPLMKPSRIVANSNPGHETQITALTPAQSAQLRMEKHPPRALCWTADISCSE